MNTIRYQLKLLEEEAGLMTTLRKHMYDDQGGLTKFGNDFMEICLRYEIPTKTIKALYGEMLTNIKT